MSKYPYPIDAGSVSLDRYLTNLLSALVKKAGGTLRISIADILKVQECVLLRYPTSNLQEIVLQLAPRNTDMYVVPEAPSWQASAPVRPQVRQTEVPPQTSSSPIPQPTTRIANTLDNLSLYLKEQEREEKLRKAQQEDEIEQRRQAGLSPFRTIPGR
jgi:hypothetical protein